MALKVSKRDVVVFGSGVASYPILKKVVTTIYGFGVSLFHSGEEDEEEIETTRETRSIRKATGTTGN